MKKMIIKIAAGALLIGGLAFNFSLTNAESIGQDTSLNVLLNTASAIDDENGNSCPYSHRGSCWVNNKSYPNRWD